MKKSLIALFLSLFLCFLWMCPACAQDQGNAPEPEETPVPDYLLLQVNEDMLLDSLPSVFSKVYIKSDYGDEYPYRSYRFPTQYDNLYDFYDPLEMTYFPHETLGEGDRNYYKRTRWSIRTTGTDRTDWGLYEVGRNMRFLHQMIYLPTPANTSVYYGRPTGREDGTLNDFYLYGDFYVSDVYPENLGSCFVSYSNSLITGFNSNKKMLLNIGRNLEYRKNVDLQVPPEGNKDWYESAEDKDYYEYYGDEDKITKSIDLVASFVDNACTDPTACYAVGNEIFPDLHLDERMLQDYQSQKKAQEKKGLTFEPKIYRVEMIRIDGIITIFVNGDLLVSVQDGISERVSWGAGPVVYPDGKSATCDLGTFVLMEK